MGKRSQKNRKKTPSQARKRAQQRKAYRKKFKQLPENQKQVGIAILRQIHKTITHYFPDLFDRFAALPEHRHGAEYKIEEVVTAALCMFLLKTGSRNQVDLLRRESRHFRKNYRKLFRLDLPSMCVVERVFRILAPEELERLKAELVRILLRKKVLCRFRLFGESYKIAVDGVHYASYAEDESGECTYQTSSGGKTTYFHKALEAKIVTSSGLSISIATEWIANDGKEYDKQDCEQKAFRRLAKKLKSYFPRLKICILADGLYPNRTFFSICKQNQWDFVVTFKDGNLSNVWKEVELLRHCGMKHSREEKASKNQLVTQDYSWVNGIEYEKFTLNWIECQETTLNIETCECTQNRFVHLTNLPASAKQVAQLSGAGRFRWKIENEGFNTQKNQGYKLGHKFSRASFNALKNYYQCMQIAHLINQLAIHARQIQDLLKQDAKLTLRFIWTELRGLLSFTEPPVEDIENRSRRRSQISLV